MTNSARWCTTFTISFLLTVLTGHLDHESKSLLDVFQAQNVPALFIYTALFAVPVAALVYLGEWVYSHSSVSSADLART